MALTIGNTTDPIQAINSIHGRSKSLGFKGSRVVLPSHKRSANLVLCSKQAGNGDDLSPDEDLEISSRLGRISFPSRFLFGAATAAFQVEGAAFGGRGECIWTTFCKKYPEKIADRSNGDIAADSYHRYREDVELLADLGMDAYRFSISWPRILPNGRGKVNQEGIQYYKNLINELHDNGIEPFVTLFHWDVPQGLEDEYGCFLDKSIAEDFKKCAKRCYEVF